MTGIFTSIRMFFKVLFNAKYYVKLNARVTRCTYVTSVNNPELHKFLLAISSPYEIPISILDMHMENLSTQNTVRLRDLQRHVRDAHDILYPVAEVPRPVIEQLSAIWKNAPLPHQDLFQVCPPPSRRL